MPRPPPNIADIDALRHRHAEASERPTRIHVDLDALSHNLRALRAHAGAPVMGIVKANAYGHGLVPVALHLQAQGIEQLGVAFLEEGIALRQAGVPSEFSCRRTSASPSRCQKRAVMQIISASMSGPSMPKASAPIWWNCR